MLTTYFCTKNKEFILIQRNQQLNIQANLASLEEPWSLAFGWETLRETFKVIAIVVNHVLLLHPSDSVPFSCIRSSILPFTGLQRIGGQGDTGWLRGPNTSIGFEVSVRSCKWSFCPVSLYKPTSCCPVISIPEAWVNPHGLAFGKWNTNWFQVVKHSYRNVIHQEPVKQEVANVSLIYSF